MSGDVTWDQNNNWYKKTHMPEFSTMILFCMMIGGPSTQVNETINIKIIDDVENGDYNPIRSDTDCKELEGFADGENGVDTYETEADLLEQD